MDKGAPPPPPPSIFVNDGSFMERFRQLQQEKKDEAKDKEAPHVVVEESKPVKIIISGISNPRPSSSATKTSIGFKTNDAQKKGGKLAFSLKQKSKLLAPPVKLGEEEDDEDVQNDQSFGSAKRPKLDAPAKSTKLSDVVVAPPAPSDPNVKNAADKLASFVAKNGRAFENVTRQKNPGDTLFKFLFDESCADYKYYAFRLSEEEKSISQAKESGVLHSGDGGPRMSTTPITSQKPAQQQRGYQTPASALYDASVESGASSRSVQASVTRPNNSDSYSAPRAADPISMMEFYMKKAAQEEKMRRPRQSKDEMPPPASLQGSSVVLSTDSGKRGHHMGDYIPPEELDKFLAKCDDVAALKATKEAAEKAKIQADNVGHKLLSKMGWKEGEGIGSSRKGMADPIMAGDVKTNNLGVGASAPGEVNPEGTMFALIFLWFGISVPLVFVGAYLGFKKPAVDDPVKTNKIPRQIPEQAWYMNPVFSILIGGILPFGAVFIELFFILTSIWLNQFYYIFGFLFLVFVILIVTCAEITVVLCYFQLCSEDYLWWWRSYLTSGSSALYLFLYATFYFFTKLQITKLVSAMLYFGYMLIASYAFFVLTGTIGFYACLWFTRLIYSSVKID